jgi:hypothetical protein
MNGIAAVTTIGIVTAGIVTVGTGIGAIGAAGTDAQEKAGRISQPSL